jgi:hypothetical protein
MLISVTDCIAYRVQTNMSVTGNQTTLGAAGERERRFSVEREWILMNPYPERQQGEPLAIGLSTPAAVVVDSYR